MEEFLELRDNTGDEARRTHNLNIANWIPDLFMRRVEEDGIWSLFDPKVVPHLPDLYGEAFEAAYNDAEVKELYVKQVKARDLYSRMRQLRSSHAEHVKVLLVRAWQRDKSRDVFIRLKAPKRQT
jgi:ribonucleotide reductase alpha subunit